MKAEGLPRDVAPGRTLSVAVAYVGDEVGEFPGVLTVVTRKGCAELAVSGRGVDEALTVQSFYAYDFGEIEAGTTSEPKEIQFLVQRSESEPAILFEGFGAGPKGVFDLVSKPNTPVSPASCDKLRMQVTFTAPLEPGPVEGAVAWDFVSGMFSGEAAAFVFGSSNLK